MAQATLFLREVRQGRGTVTAAAVDVDVDVAASDVHLQMLLRTVLSLTKQGAEFDSGVGLDALELVAGYSASRIELGFGVGFSTEVDSVVGLLSASCVAQTNVLVTSPLRCLERIADADPGWCQRVLSALLDRAQFHINALALSRREGKVG